MVVPVFNGGRDFGRCLRRLAGSQAPTCRNLQAQAGDGFGGIQADGLDAVNGAYIGADFVSRGPPLAEIGQRSEPCGRFHFFDQTPGEIELVVKNVGMRQDHEQAAITLYLFGNLQRLRQPAAHEGLGFVFNSDRELENAGFIKRSAVVVQPKRHVRQRIVGGGR